jgi:hypothetical protein
MTEKLQVEVIALLLSVFSLFTGGSFTVGIYETIRHPHSAWPLMIGVSSAGILFIVLCWFLIMAELLSDVNLSKK